MAKSDTWMPLYIGDYLADTGRLTTEGHGAYLLIIMDYWRNGAPPDHDETLASIARLPLPRWKKLRPSIVGLFKPENGIWHHKRVDEEMSKASDITKERSAAGKAGAEARWKQRNGKRIANAMANAQQNDAPSQSPSQDSVANATGADAPSGALLPDDESEDLKTRIFGPALQWLSKQTKKPERSLRALVGKWCSQHGDGATLEAMQQASRNAPLDPVPYIERLLQSPRAGPAGAPRFTNAFAQLHYETHHELPHDDR